MGNQGWIVWVTDDNAGNALGAAIGMESIGFECSLAQIIWMKFTKIYISLQYLVVGLVSSFQRLSD